MFGVHQSTFFLLRFSRGLKTFLWYLLTDAVCTVLAKCGAKQWSPTLAHGPVSSGRQFFPWTGEGLSFQDDSSTLHLFLHFISIIIHRLPRDKQLSR